MTYKLPFTAISKALYATLNGQGLEWFDSAVPISEIEDYFRSQAEFAYGILGAADMDARDTKTGPVWTMTINLQIYSNYRGRKDVAQKLEATFCLLASPEGRAALNKSLNDDGFTLVDLTIGAVSISLPIVGDAGEWQNGSINLKIRVGQLKED
jgi:hypothetical protein